MNIEEEIKKLVQAIEDEEKRNPGFTAPSKLRQGCISYVSDHILTEEELDQLWLETFGHT